jgi:hypothetical protein
LEGLDVEGKQHQILDGHVFGGPPAGILRPRTSARPDSHAVGVGHRSSLDRRNFKRRRLGAERNCGSEQERNAHDDLLYDKNAAGQLFLSISRCD